MPELPPVTMNTLPLKSGRVLGLKVMSKLEGRYWKLIIERFGLVELYLAVQLS